MKNLMFISTLLLLISCNNGKEEKIMDAASNSSTPNEVENSTKNIINQENDYSKLYLRDNNDCTIIEPSEIASVLGIQESQVIKEPIEGTCRYTITLPDGTSSSLGIGFTKMPNAEVKREIANYQSKSGGLEHYISDTGDTDLCIHPYNSWLFLYNANYDNTIKLSYGSKIALRGMTKEQKEVRKTNALKIANYIEKKYKQ
ncbi:MAG: hypothetical protein R2781_05815 [Flavobacteriaceae bacterium]